MAKLNWDQSMSVGVTTFDDDHKKLLAMLSQLSDAIVAHKAKDALGKVLDALVDYTKEHFAREEDAMLAHSLSGYEEHKREHDTLTKQVLAIQEKYHAYPTSTLTLEVMNFLKNWLLLHIQGTDKKYTELLGKALG